VRGAFALEKAPGRLAENRELFALVGLVQVPLRNGWPLPAFAEAIGAGAQRQAGAAGRTDVAAWVFTAL
jgi:hypothetical protein